MAQHTGKQQIFRFNSLDLTNSIASEITWSTSADEIDASTINSAGTKSYLQGPYESTFDVSGVWDDSTASVAAVNATLYNNITNASGTAGGGRVFDYWPGGSAAAKPHYYGSAFLTSFEISGAVDGMVGFSMTLRTSGSVLYDGTGTVLAPAGNG